MKKRTWLALALSGFLAVLMTPAWGQAQAVVTAQILDFWRLLSVGGTFSGTTLSFANLSIIGNGYANFGATLGSGGYGIRDSGGVIQIKNAGGSWSTPAGGAIPTGTFLVQVANASLPNAQALGALGTGLVLNTTTTGVQSIFGGTSCTNQFPRSLNASGAATCSSVSLSTDITGVLNASGFPALTGDVTTVAGAVATTLATVNTNTGVFGTSTTIPVLNINGKGLITAASSVTPQLTISSTYFSSLSGANLTGVPTSALTGTVAAGNFPALTGDVTSSGGTLATTVSKIGGNTVSFGGALTLSGANPLTFTTTGSTSVTLPVSGTLLSNTLSGLSGVLAHQSIIGGGASNVTGVAGCTNGVLWWALVSVDPTCNNAPIFGTVGSTSTQIVGGTGLAGSAASTVRLTKSVTGITDATPTALVTVTIPNAAQSAVVHVRIDGSIGAGGAIGANECSAILDGEVVVARTSGLTAVVTAATGTETASACVAGATTITLAYAASAVSGGAAVTQTFTITGTITKGGGGSANHTATVLVDVSNANASGVTVS